MPTLPLKPRFSLRADTSSGDNPTTPTLGNRLVPVGNFFDTLQDPGPGPVNFIDVHPRIQTVFPHAASFLADLLVYWRKSLIDGVYSVRGTLIRPATVAPGLWATLGWKVRWQINRHAYLQSDCGIFFAGPFLRQTMPGQTFNYLSFWAGYKF
jgi:hypothetical protein